MPELSAAGSTRAWRQRRLRILARDTFTCHYCGGFANHVDHVIPRARGGGDDDANLVAACSSCNLSRGAGPRTTPPSRSW